MEFIKQFSKCEIYSATLQYHDHVNDIHERYIYSLAKAITICTER